MTAHDRGWNLYLQWKRDNPNALEVQRSAACRHFAYEARRRSLGGAP